MGITYQPQLVIAGFLNHQQYGCNILDRSVGGLGSWKKLIVTKKQPSWEISIFATAGIPVRFSTMWDPLKQTSDCEYTLPETSIAPKNDGFR